MKKTALSLFILWMLLLIGITSAQEPPARVTILYDARHLLSCISQHLI
jgi:hypothetical protein